MTTRGSNSPNLVLKLFLEQPSKKKRFDDFFLLCYCLVRGYLRHLQKLRWNLPFDLTSDRDQLGDLTIDVLGPILASTPGRPCYRILDYLEKVSIGGISEADSDLLYGSFTAHLFLLAREELRALRKESDPQVEHLKRRFSDTLSGGAFASFSHDGSGTTYVCLATSDQRKRDHLPIISYDDLEKIVETAYHESQTRSQWCRMVFEIIEERQDIRNCIKKHELLKAAVNVNILVLRDESLLAPLPNSPESDLRLAVADEARRQTLNWLKDCVIASYIQKQSISESAGDRYLEAVDHYLQDLVYSAGVDKLPVYFREVMPEVEHGKYLKLYKHTFETTMNRADEDFKKRLRKSL